MIAGRDLVDHFVRSLPADLRERAGSRDVADRLLRIVLGAPQAWPSVHVPEDTFVAHLAGQIGAGPGGEDLAATLDALHGEDLYLACACAAGDPAALACFEQAFAREITGGSRAMAGDAIRADDFKQALREKLFLGRGGRGPKISEYSGRGRLRTWVAVAARRTYLDLVRALGRVGAREGEAIDEEARDVDVDPELDYLKRRYRVEFRAAFEEALTALSVRQRNLLRLHLVHRLQVGQIAATFGVHRITASRWIEQARGDLYHQTQAALSRRLRVDDKEFASIMRLIRSQFDVSITRVLGRDAE